MAEKVSTLILDVDLECEKCFKMIQKVLCKLQVKENIRNISFDTKNNKVTISGPFDPGHLSRKLRCKACEAIKNIKIADEKKPEEKKPDGKKPDEKKPDDKKPDDKKTDKPKDGPKEAAASASSTTVNLKFTQVCNICYPWPCSDPSHCGARPQQSHCEGIPVPSHHQQPAWGVTPRWNCGGPSYCGGCGSCRGGGGAYGLPAIPPPMCCPGSSCRGCKGCRIVQEGRFIYEEYPPSSCAIM